MASPTRLRRATKRWWPSAAACASKRRSWATATPSTCSASSWWSASPRRCACGGATEAAAVRRTDMGAPPSRALLRAMRLWHNGHRERSRRQCRHHPADPRPRRRGGGRAGRGVIRDLTRPRLRRWAADSADPGQRGGGARRIDAGFGTGERSWNEELVLQRYELLYGGGLVPGGARNRPVADPVPGEPM